MATDDETTPRERVVRTEAEWRQTLDPMQFKVLRQAATERPFTGRYVNTEDAGTYVCAGCKTSLFRSETKFHSGCGWPSFFDDLGDGIVEVRRDRTHGMIRDEIVCTVCEGHLGHVFTDGPPPTGKRYCVNSASIELIKDA